MLGARWVKGYQHPPPPSPGADSPSTLPGGPGVSAGGPEEEQMRPEEALNGPLEPQILQDNLTLSLAEVLPVSLPRPPNKETHPHRAPS